MCSLYHHTHVYTCIYIGTRTHKHNTQAHIHTGTQAHILTHTHRHNTQGHIVSTCKLLDEAIRWWGEGEEGGRSRKRWMQRTRMEDKLLDIIESTNSSGPWENTYMRERERERERDKWAHKVALWVWSPDRWLNSESWRLLVLTQVRVGRRYSACLNNFTYNKHSLSQCTHVIFNNL